MAGLLDNPNDAAMWQAAMGLLSAGGSSPRPVTLGQAMGMAGMGAMDAYRQTEAHNMRKQMSEAQMQQFRMQMDEALRRQNAMQSMRGQLPEGMQNIFDVAPDAVIGQMFRPPEKPQLVTVVGPDGQPMQKWVRPGEATGVDVGQAPNKESALPWYVRKGPNGQTSIDPAFAEFEKAKAASGRPVTPFYQFLPTAEGYAVGDARSGQITPASIGGRPVVKASDDPMLQGRIAQAKEVGKTMGEETTKAALDAPRVIQNAETALRLSDELLTHPGFKQAVGTSSLLGIQKIPGTSARDFMNRLDQVKGGAFLEAFNSLKGGGQITEVEGKKATDAIARMDNSTSEEEFRQAVKDYQAVIRNGVNRAKMKANPVAPVSQPAAPQSGAKFLGFE